MFKLKQNSLQVLQVIVEEHAQIVSLKLVSHPVEINWRELNIDSKDKIKNLKISLVHSIPTKEKIYSRNEFLNLDIHDLPKILANEVWSFVSKVACDDGIARHIPMMNFHPIDISKKEVVESIRYICNKHKGVVLDSGRFFHYYGNHILTESEWIKFMSDFLMPCVLVSPRYIGHRLNDGYCTLRCTSDNKYKTKIPEVIELI